MITKSIIKSIEILACQVETEICNEGNSENMVMNKDMEYCVNKDCDKSCKVNIKHYTLDEEKVYRMISPHHVDCEFHIKRSVGK